jgi:hypothetical protein
MNGLRRGRPQTRTACGKKACAGEHSQESLRRTEQETTPAILPSCNRSLANAFLPQAFLRLPSLHYSLPQAP